MAVSHFPRGFADGVTVRNVPIVSMSPGKVVWVNNSTVLAPGATAGSDNLPGTYARPKSTIGGAISALGAGSLAGQGSPTFTANRGDIVLVMPNHAETVAAAAGINLSIAGAMVVGLANGEVRPTITSSTLTTATFKVSANNCVIKNMVFINGVASQVTQVLVAGKSTRFEDCRFAEGAATQPLIDVTVGSAANDSDRTEFVRCDFYHPTAAATDAILLKKAQNSVRIRDCVFHGDYSDAAIGNSTSAAQADIQIDNVRIVNLHASAYGINLQTTTGTGIISNSVISCDTQSKAASTGTVVTANVLWSDITTASAAAVPANAVPTSTTALAQANALPFVVTKTLTSSAITTGGVTALTANAVGGGVMVVDYVIRTDSTGLAGGTNFTLTSNDVNGAAVTTSHAVSSLGANISLSKSALTTGYSFTLEPSKVLTAKCTVGNCTGAGTIKIDFYCIPIGAGASVS